MQVLVRAIVSGREPGILSGPFSPKAFAAAALTMVSSDGGTRVPTYTSLVPAQLSRLLDAAADDPAVAAALRSFETILVGGQALPPIVHGTRRRRRAPGSCGRTARPRRAAGASTTAVRCGGVGVRIADGEVQIVGSDARRRLSRRSRGDGCRVPPATTAAGGTAQATRASSRTALLRVRGRIDNVIVSGGVNISLDRVERIVRSVPGLAGAVVVGVPDARWGEASVVVAPRGEALRRSESVQLEEARTAVAAEIGPYARPSRLVLVDELATLPSGKPDREAIRRAARRRCADPRSGRLVDDAEPIALGVLEDDPVGVLRIVVPVDLPCADAEQPLDLRRLVVGVQVEVDPGRIVLGIPA